VPIFFGASSDARWLRERHQRRVARALHASRTDRASGAGLRAVLLMVTAHRVSRQSDHLRGNRSVEPQVIDLLAFSWCCSRVRWIRAPSTASGRGETLALPLVLLREQNKASDKFLQHARNRADLTRRRCDSALNPGEA
jgi:hypothetical protein